MSTPPLPESPSPAPRSAEAPLPKSRYAAFLLVAAAGCGLDLWTKHVMFAWPKLRQSVHWLLPDIAGFQVSVNEGALFGFGQGGQLWFAVLSVVAAVAIPVWLFSYGQARDQWVNLTLGAILGGVLGNLYDRAGLHAMRWGRDWPLYGDHQQGDRVYAVRDWILLQAGEDWRWPNFNIADSLLVVGAALLLLHSFRQPTHHDAATPEAVTGDDPK
ncbi:MAG: signal peptidase II [Planctomycetota bacterium]